MSRLFYHVMQDNAGNLLFDVSGTMRVAGSGTLATIYGDEELTVVLPNPMTNHPSFGSFKCFLGAGAYDFYMAKSGYTFETLTGVQGHGTMALQNANAVTIGGHANTGVLDVQSSVQASDVPTQYYGVRVWPVAPSGASLVEALRVDPATGAGLAGAGIIGLAIIDQPAGIPGAQGLALNITAGGGRYNVYASGTANNYFAGNVGIANIAPSYPLDVTGNARVTGSLAAGSMVNTGPMAIGTTDLTDNCALKFRWTHQTHFGMRYQPLDNDTGGGHPLEFKNVTGTTIGSIATTASATAFNTSSDVRLKHAVQALDNAIATIQALRPVSFKWRADESEGHGFLANEVQRIVPEAVTGEPDAVDEAGQIVPQQMDHSKLVPWLVGACQELAQQVQTLTARVAQLEGA